MNFFLEITHGHVALEILNFFMTVFLLFVSINMILTRDILLFDNNIDKQNQYQSQ
jgi:hypothetical protein